MRVLLLIAVGSAVLQSASALAERSIHACEKAPPRLEMEKVLRLVEARLKKEHKGGVSFESAVLQCREKSRFWEVHARPLPYSSTKFVLLVQMDGSVINSGVVTDG